MSHFEPIFHDVSEGYLKGRGVQPDLVRQIPEEGVLRPGDLLQPFLG